MQVNAYFILPALLLGCGADPVEADTRTQAVRAISVRNGPVQEGRRHVAEVVPRATVRVLAQVPGTISEVSVLEGVPVLEGADLIRISAPDIAARIGRVRAERGRAERERDFACDQLGTDRVLAKAGDLPTVQLDRSEKGCAAAGLAVDAARAAEREVSVAGGKAWERAPFDGQVLAQLVDEGQNVMPGTPLLAFGSRERQLRIRVPETDLVDIAVGSRVDFAAGAGRVVEIGAQAQGPGRLVEVLIDPDGPLEIRPGSMITATVILDSRPSASSVPEDAVGQGEEGPYVLLIEGDALRRVEVVVGPRQDGWVALESDLPEGTLVVSGALRTLDLTRPVLVVIP